MPMYSYKCSGCGHKQIISKPMSESSVKEECDNCQEITMRDFSADAFHTSKGQYDRPIVSDAMAVNTDQIAEHKKLFPDVRITSEGQPIMENYAQHKNYLDKTGQIKHPAKTRGKSRVVSSIK